MLTRRDNWGDPFGERDTRRDRRGTPHPKWVAPESSGMREKHDHPYSYSEFFIFGGRGTIAEPNIDAVYSDRLWQWDHTKAEACSKAFPKAWKQPLGNAKALSDWMSRYQGEPVTVVALAEGCNASNGYPYWIVWFKKIPVSDEGSDG